MPGLSQNSYLVTPKYRRTMEDPKIDRETSSNTPKHGDRIVGFEPPFGGIRWRRRRIKRR
jgi:hypothetical protein